LNKSSGELAVVVPPPASAGPSLLRALGPITAISVVVGNVIGSGIFLKPGTIAAEGGRFPLIIGIWALGGVLCIFGALCIAELAAMLPRAGGLYVYLREAYGDTVAFLFGWTEALFSRPASIGALAVAFMGSFMLALGWKASDFTGVVLASALILGLAAINIVGVVWGGGLQLATAIIKAGFLALMGLIPFVVDFFAPSTVSFGNYATEVQPRQASLSLQIGAVLLAVMWAYDGWHGITPLAEEVRSPQRTLPLALFGGIGILIVLYITANVAYHGVLTMNEMSAAGEHAAEHAMGKVAGHAGLKAVSLIILFSTFGAINSTLLQTPRITFAMGRDGLFFRSLGRVHANYRTPVISILLTSLVAIAMIIAAAVAKFLFHKVDAAGLSGELTRRVVLSLQQDSIFDLLTNFVIFSVSIFYLLAVLAVVILRIRRPDLERPYRTWGYPVVPVLFIAAYIWFLSQVYLGSPLESHTGLVIIALGLPVYFAYRKWGQKAG
jgi:APA family basic amino acid/polyamine antiporter